MHPYEQFLPTPILHQRILFFAAALYTLGILFGTAYTAPAWLFVLLAGAFLLLGCLLNRGRNLFAFAYAAMFCIGLLGGNLAGSPVYPSLDLEATALVTGRVVAVSNKETYCTYRLEEVAINGEAVAGGVFLTSYTTTYIQDDRIAAQAKLSVPEKALYTGDFDDWRYCRSQNVLFRANAGKDALLSHAQDPLAWIHAAGRWMSGRLEEFFPRHANLAKAFVLGDEGDITQLQREQLSLVGITHILSISGSHIAILAGILHRIFSRRKINRWIPFLCCQAVVFFYTVLTGWKVSMVRAAWMYEVALLGNFLGERTDTPTSLAAAYLGILAPNPARIYDLGLQLSFGAVYAMILLCPMLEEGMQKISWKPLRQTLSAGLAAAIGTFPITNNLSNYYWLPNLAANALATLYSLALIPLLLALSALYLVFGRLVAFLGGFGASLLDLFEWFTLSCTKYERIGIYLPSLLGGVVVLWYLCIFFCSDKVFLPGRYKRLAACVVCLLFMGNLVMPLYRRDRMQMRCFASEEVSVLISTEEGKQFLLSGGSGAELEEYLLATGRRVDAAILAHKGKGALELLMQLRRMHHAETAYADAASARICRQKYGMEEVEELSEWLPLSPRMALRFLFVAQGEPMAAVLYIDESPVCCFVFAFFEDAAERVGKVPILYYPRAGNSRLPAEMPHGKLLLCDSSGTVESGINLYQVGETVFYFEEAGKYRRESRYAGVGFFE